MISIYMKKLTKEFFINTFILDDFGFTGVDPFIQFILIFLILFIESLVLSLPIRKFLNIDWYPSIFNLVIFHTFFVMLCSFICSKRYKICGIRLCINMILWPLVFIRALYLIKKFEYERKIKFIKEIMNS